MGAFLPGVAVAMLLGRFWKRVNWQGGLACIGIHLVLNRADKDDIPAPHTSEPEK